MIDSAVVFDQAAAVIDALWPVVAILVGFSLGFSILNMIQKSIMLAMGRDWPTARDTSYTPTSQTTQPTLTQAREAELVRAWRERERQAQRAADKAEVLQAVADLLQALTTRPPATAGGGSCSKCGGPLPKDSLTCGYCGTTNTRETPPT